MLQEEIEVSMADMSVPAEEVTSGPKGIGGWLLLPAIGVSITPIFGVVGLFTALSSPLTLNLFALISHGLLGIFSAIFGLYEILFKLLIVVASAFLFYLFFTERYIFPKFYILCTVLSIFLSFFEIGFIYILTKYIDIPGTTSQDISKEISSEISNTIILILPAMIWFSYFSNSRRVKNTFTNKEVGKRRRWLGIQNSPINLSPLIVQCWRCKAPIEVAFEMRGKKIRCLSCRTKQQLPI